MTANRDEKRSAADSRSPLEQAGILQRVLDYVGPGHWCFVAEVCSTWRALYVRVTSREVRASGAVQNGFFSRTITCISQMTTFSAMFASPSRVRPARARELDCTAIAYQYAAGKHAGIATLEAAHEEGMQYTHRVMDGALYCNQLTVVQFLRAQDCPWGSRVFNFAAERGDIDFCIYLLAEQCPWDESTCEDAASNDVSTVRWLRKHGCPWDAREIGVSAAWVGSVEVLVYLQEQSVATAEALTNLLNVAGANNKLAAA